MHTAPVRSTPVSAAPSRPRTSTIVFAIIVAVAGVLTVWPQLIGAERWFGLAQLVALRGIVLLALAATLLALAILAVASRRLRWLSGVVAIGVALAASVTLATLLDRGAAVHAPARGDLVVLSYNTQLDAPGAAAVTALVREHRPHVVVLPETSELLAKEVVAALAAEGAELRAHAAYSPDGGFETSILIDASLGEYERDESAGSTPLLPSGVWRPVDGDGPVLVAAHPHPPLPGAMKQWSDGLDWLADRCSTSNASGESVIIAGDLNATLDHFGRSTSGATALGSCADAAERVDAAALGTWPTSLPPALGAPIDHVLATPDLVPVSFTVLETMDEAGSDHRPIVAVFERQ